MSHPPTPPSPRRILLGGRLAPEVSQWLGARRPELECRAREELDEISAADLEWAEVYLGFTPPSASLAGFGWVHAGGAGVESFLADGVLGPDTLLTRTTGDMGYRIGEYCAARMLAHRQRFRFFLSAQEDHRWRRREVSQLRGSRAVVVGTGSVGLGIAKVLAALRLYLIGVSASGSAKEPFDEVHTVAALPELTGEADWLILAMPLTERTAGMIGPVTLSACRGSFLINVGRGGVLDHEALLDALDHGRLSGAALDVFPEEPLPAESPLWDRPDIMITPHVAALTTVEEVGTAFLECLGEVSSGARPSLTVDRNRGY